MAVIYPSNYGIHGLLCEPYKFEPCLGVPGLKSKNQLNADFNMCKTMLVSFMVISQNPEKERFLKVQTHVQMDTFPSLNKTSESGDLNLIMDKTTSL